MDLHWLTAPEPDVAEAMASARRSGRPAWVPNRRQVIVHIDHCLILWYVGIAGFVFGVRIDTLQNNRITATDVVQILICLGVLAAWLVATRQLHRWARRPPSPKARLAEWRQTLTALANGFESSPRPAQTFVSTLLPRTGRMREYPRFVAPGIEFGAITHEDRTVHRWRFIAVTLEAPLPHLILDAVANDHRQRPAVDVDRDQRLRLEGDFDRYFRAYAPSGYGRDALYVLTPDTMLGLIEAAAHEDVEVVDRSIVFLRPEEADFRLPETWNGVARILENVVPRVSRSAARYLDDRVPGQETPRLLAQARATALAPSAPRALPAPRITRDGERLRGRRRDGGARWLMAGIGWVALLAFLYAVPGLFGFAGIMSIIDGR